MNAILNSEDLRQFTGSEHIYRHVLAPNVVYTDGVKYVAETAGAYWLIDEIAFSQMMKPIQKEEFQVWKLVKKDKNSCQAILSCEDGNDNQIYSKEIGWTDFPLDEISLWYTNNTILLPSEY